MTSKVTRKFCWNEKGALEGLPLYLIILVVIAAVAIIIIFTYLSTLQTVELDEIEIYVDGKKLDPKETTPGEHEVYVIATGSDGKKLKDVTVSISGPQLNKARKTGSDGKADFGTINFTADGTPYQVSFSATYTGGNVDTPVDDDILIRD